MKEIREAPERALDLLDELISYDNFEAYPPNAKDRVCAFVEDAELEACREAKALDRLATTGEDARELAGDIVDDVSTEIQGAIGRTTARIERFVAERERKAREEEREACAERALKIKAEFESAGVDLPDETLAAAIKEAPDA